MIKFKSVRYLTIEEFKSPLAAMVLILAMNLLRYLHELSFTHFYKWLAQTIWIQFDILVQTDGISYDYSTR